MSVIGGIRAVIKAHLEAMLEPATSAAWFADVFDDIRKPSTRCPVAVFLIGGGSNIRPDFNAEIDTDHELQIWIEATTLADAEDILKQLQGLWLDDTRMSAMRDAGCINVTPLDVTTPVPVEGENRFAATAVFNLHVRYEY